MLKSLIDIDVRKVAVACGIIILFALPISQDAIPQVPLSIFFAPSGVTYVKATAALLCWICGIITGGHNIAALISPKTNGAA